MPAEQRLARVHGWHRALKMWSRVNRGTPECPGLVFALLSGGSCQGAVLRVPQRDGEAVLHQLWDREMVTGVYDPKWLHCQTAARPGAGTDLHAVAQAAPTSPAICPRSSYRDIFAALAAAVTARTLDYARQTLHCLQQHGIHDPALHRLLHHAREPAADA